MLKFFGEYNAKKFIKYLPSYKYVRLLDVASVNGDKVDGLIVICAITRTFCNIKSFNSCK